MDFSEITSVFETIDITYVVLCNIITYLLIQTIESISGKNTKTGVKRIISTISALFLGVFMWLIMDHEGEGLFYGFFLQFLTWDYLFKGWLNKLSRTFGHPETEKHNNDEKPQE